MWSCSSKGPTHEQPGIALDGLGSGDHQGKGAGEGDLNAGDFMDFGPFPDGFQWDGGDPCFAPPYGFGCPCDENSQCEVGFCVEGPDGFLCTSECLEECPEGWQCKGVSGFGSDVIFLCMPESKKLCYPCDKDSQCGNGGTCTGLPEGNYCSVYCDESSPCPDTFSCVAEGDDPLAQSICIPNTGSCECTWKTAGQLRPCSETSEHGTCLGFETCDGEAGWVDCSAAEPVAELCDGQDNDCDGKFDEDLPESPQCENEVEGVGTCPGVSICMGPDGWVCTAVTPEPEECDFVDNDCDGMVDEDFKIDDKYGMQNHCGTCNHDCTESIPDAVVVCDVSLPSSQCVIESCSEGYYKFNDFQCLPEGETLCKPCVNDQMCEGGVCADFAGGKFCTWSCDQEECPEFYECLPVDQLTGEWCVPVSGTCDCNKDNPGAVRPCSVENQVGTCFGFETCDPGQGWMDCTALEAQEEDCDGLDNDCDGVPDDGLPETKPCSIEEPDIGTCHGVEVCLGSQGWVCGAATPELEKCDYKDNDCDGEADEEFIIEGKYATLHHCGSCGTDCEAAFPNAVALCDSTLATPECRVDHCLEGFYPLNDYQCIEPPDVQCKQCESDQDCYFDLCVPLDQGKYCLEPCDDGACEAGFFCEALGDGVEVCVPETKSCECTAANQDVKRSCQVTTDFGTCFGFEVCQADTGWTECDAPEAKPEECDGVDNDCNGIIDDDLPDSQPCKNVNDYGTCDGIEVCMGNLSWVCQALEPQAEVCDYQDNNCDGEVDEPFKNDEGKYDDFTHCGSCSVSCEAGFPNAVAHCDATKQAPKCVVKKCLPGYFKLNEFQCIPDVANLCESCSTDENCLMEGARCIPLADGTFCSKQCQTNEDCPAGYACQPFDGDQQCFPLTGSCTCDGSNTDLSKSCSLSWPPNPAEGEQFITCYGTQLCNVDGWSECQLDGEVCDGVDNDCNGAVDDGFLVDGKYSSDQHCGQCGNNCTFLVYDNAKGVCDDSQAVPDCKMKCSEGFHDVNANPADGCECEFISATDLPDVDCVDPPECTQVAKDQNCDGVDGELAGAVFVAKNGSDAGAGTIDEPMLSIQAAVDKAADEKKRDVYVATGVYSGSILLAAGVQLWGGYSSDFKQRNIVLYETVVMGGLLTAKKPGAITASGITGAVDSTVVDGFSIYGRNNNEPGGSSYAVYVGDCDKALRLTNNRVVAGHGGDGSPGLNGLDGPDGVDGSPGTNSITTNHDCTGSPKVLGGAGGGTQNGGEAKCGEVNVSGGAGGDSNCPEWDPSPGLPPGENENGGNGQGIGAGSGGGAGGDGLLVKVGTYCSSCAVPPDSHIKEGEDGGQGSTGDSGVAGAGCEQVEGTVVNGLWQVADGGSGGPGLPGGGGGGGGAGGGGQANGGKCSNDHLGGTGGGGGSGACAGTSGTGGTSGGASFALFVYYTEAPATVPRMEDNLMEAGFGGNGGHGGNGGTGGVGGTGAQAGLGAQGNAFCSFNGGTGGDGGNGGHGGGGGGGGGGASYCIYAFGQGGADLSSYKSNNTCITGTEGGGGAGGPSIGAPGIDGKPGASGEANF